MLMIHIKCQTEAFSLISSLKNQGTNETWVELLSSQKEFVNSHQHCLFSSRLELAKKSTALVA